MTGAPLYRGLPAVDYSGQADAREGSLALRMLDAERSAQSIEQTPDWQVLARRQRQVARHRRWSREMNVLVALFCLLGFGVAVGAAWVLLAVLP